MELTFWKILYNMFQNQDVDTLNIKYAKWLLQLINPAKPRNINQNLM